MAMKDLVSLRDPDTFPFERDRLERLLRKCARATRAIWQRSWRLAVCPLALAVLCLSTGCEQSSGEISQVQTNLGWLGSSYGMYVGNHSGQTPKTVDDLRQFVEKRISAEELTRLRVANANELFVSPRDGKPFRMVSYPKLPAPAGGTPPPMVLYEEVGQNGQRAIAYLGGGTEVVDEARLRQMLPGESS